MTYPILIGKINVAETDEHPHAVNLNDPPRLSDPI
jgi:hypothetical protein